MVAALVAEAGVTTRPRPARGRGGARCRSLPQCLAGAHSEQFGAAGPTRARDDPARRRGHRAVRRRGPDARETRPRAPPAARRVRYGRWPASFSHRGNFFFTAPFKLAHDAEQLDYLIARGALPRGGFAELARRLREVGAAPRARGARGGGGGVCQE